MMSGGCEVDIGGKGPTVKATHYIICLTALPQLWTPDLSVMEATRIDR